VKHKVGTNCAQCGISEKFCEFKQGKGPSWCPTRNEGRYLKGCLTEYDKPPVREFARMASVQEASCYAERDAHPFVLRPTKTRLEELIEFSRRMGYQKLGIAFCAGLASEALLLSRILQRHGFEIVGTACKVGGVPKERIGVKEREKVRIGHFETMCNPIAQAKFLNRANTDFNILLGLCIGHDSLFLKYVRGLTTVFAVKDRVTGHNPLAVLYTSRTYYERLLNGNRRQLSKKKRVVPKGQIGR
jgi:uncharacterized metal-binding protein